MSKVPVNPFALGAAFVARAVELGWVEVDSDGRRSSYYLTASGSEGLEKFGVKIETAMQFAVLAERNGSAPKRRASSSMQAHRGSMRGGSMSPHGGRPPHRGSVPAHGGASDRGRHSGPHKGPERRGGPGHYEGRVRNEERRPHEGQVRNEGRRPHEGYVRHDRQGGPRKRTER